MSSTAVRVHFGTIVYLVGFVVYVAIRGVFGARTKGNQQAVSRAGALDRALVGLVFIGHVVLPVLYLLTSWLGFADYRLPTVMPWSGSVVMVVALWLFWRAHADLGLNWSITLALRKDHELITRGVYRRVRHPMYAAIFLFAIAQGFLFPNWLAGWGAFGSFAILYLVRVSREEQMMGEFFGESYRDYIKGTGRLAPRLFRRRF